MIALLVTSGLTPLTLTLLFLTLTLALSLEINLAEPRPVAILMYNGESVVTYFSVC